ncbi:uncharacterized protein BP5553_05369 [Venustampulla echinocandica]|uniref:Uncharacterized protein n=1 Tax=Venustampulla echinocandica TaxID=2656787 RepID=A0A370TQX3_9HELO|nr:uncharacterized protein BP5553_05369 [Venustampulla echinocandica]RDL37936.1 hypothetical protein BP5553_05369 [Venustampulla echinocandica]
MLQISVGEVSGIIAAAVFAVQLFLSLAIPGVLIAFISEENSLVTWSVLGRFLHSSYWPSILSTDTAATTGVQRHVNTIGWFQTGALLLLTIASVATPLGLYDSIEPSKSQTKTLFSYIPDDSPFGYGTPPRSDTPFSRNCGGDVACPGSTLNQTCNQAGSLQICTSEYNRTVPETLSAIYKNGATSFNPSVSSIFDIQWRTYKNGTDTSGAEGWSLQSAYRQLSLLILDEGVKLVEGLLVDMDRGGIGFRNHTAPQQPPPYGSTWDEDILFIEPETQCVSLNLTVDFQLPMDNTGSVRNLRLTDRGGFSALSHTAPSLDMPPNGQLNLDLKERAYKAAWLNNFLTLKYFNATDSDLSNISRIDVAEGTAFPITAFSQSASVQFGEDIIRSNTEFGDYLNLTNTASRNQSNGYANPFGINARNFSAITNLCAGSSGSSLANINSSIVGCCLLYGAANRTDGGSRLITDPGSPWSIPIYSCASTIKATIRTVTFQYNATGIEALKIKATKPKTYQDSKSLPLWGVEDLQSLRLGNAQPLWGVLGTSNSTNIPTAPYNISKISQESLYLPGFQDQFFNDGLQPVPITGQNLPGVEFYYQALASALRINRPGAVGYQGFADYSGKTSFALYAKWQNLSSSVDSTSKILDLVWTDVAANAVVGTKGWGLSSVASGHSKTILKRASEGNGDDAPQSQVPITIYEKRIRYRILYAIPAFIIAAITVAVICTVSVLAIMGRTGLKQMRKFLDAASAGRIVGRLLWPEKGTGKGTKDWIEAVGTRRVTITSTSISAEGESLMDGAEEITSGHGKDNLSVSEVVVARHAGSEVEGIEMEDVREATREDQQGRRA